MCSCKEMENRMPNKPRGRKRDAVKTAFSITALKAKSERCHATDLKVVCPEVSSDRRLQANTDPIRRFLRNVKAQTQGALSKS